MTAIAITVFVLGCAGTLALKRGWFRGWFRVWLVCMALEVEALKARDRGKGRDPSKYERRAPMQGVRPGELP